MTIKSVFQADELKKRWDEVTSFKNFAGGDETLDDVFISRRYGNIVRLTRKPKAAHDIYSAVFWGIIKDEKNGTSSLRGFFGISIADFLITAVIYAIYGYITRAVFSRGQTTSAYGMIAVAAVLLILVFITLPKTKKRFIELFDKIAKDVRI